MQVFLRTCVWEGEGITLYGDLLGTGQTGRK